MNKEGFIEIFLDDLKQEVQKEIVEILGEDNYDIVPIVVIPVPEE
jgi:hypothetical protein